MASSNGTGDPSGGSASAEPASNAGASDKVQTPSTFVIAAVTPDASAAACNDAPEEDDVWEDVVWKSAESEGLLAGRMVEVQGLASIKEEESPECTGADERCENDHSHPAPPASTAIDSEVFCESVQFLYDGLRKAYEHCGSNADEVRALSKRMDSIVDKMNSFERHIAKQLQLCLDREGEHFSQMCSKEREVQNQGLEEVRKDLAEEKAQALLRAEERDLASRRKFAELTAGEVRWLVEMTNDKFMEVQQDVECLRRQLASSTSQTPRFPDSAKMFNSDMFGLGGLLSNSALSKPLDSEPMLNIVPPCPALSPSAAIKFPKRVDISAESSCDQSQASSQTGQLSARGAAPAGPRTSRGIRPVAEFSPQAITTDVAAEGVNLPWRLPRQGLASKPLSPEEAPRLVAEGPSSSEPVGGISWV